MADYQDSDYRRLRSYLSDREEPGCRVSPVGPGQFPILKIGRCDQ